MQTRVLFQLGTMLLCAVALAAHLASFAFVVRLPAGPQSESESEVTADTRSAVSVDSPPDVSPAAQQGSGEFVRPLEPSGATPLEPSSVDGRQLRSVDDDSSSTSKIDNASRSIALVDREVVEEIPKEGANEEIVEKTANKDDEKSVEEPQFEPIEEPRPKPIDEPRQQPVDEPRQKPVEEPSQKPLDEPAKVITADEFPPMTLPEPDEEEDLDATAPLPVAPVDAPAKRLSTPIYELPPLKPSKSAVRRESDSQVPNGATLDATGFPPLTLPSDEGAEEIPNDPFIFKLRNQRNELQNPATKFTGQITDQVVPEPLPAPVPQDGQPFGGALELPKDAAAEDPSSREAPPVEFAPIKRDADQALLLQAARNAFHLEDSETAIQRFTDYLRRYPNDAEVRLEFAGILSANNRAAAGAAQVEHLLKQFPDNLAVLRRYADMQMQLNHYEKAEPILDRLIEYDRYRIDAAVDLARVYANTSRRQAAVQIYQQYLKGVATRESGRKLQFAKLLLDIRRPTEALQLLLDLHNTEPLDMDVLQLMILASARTGNKTNTLEYIDRLRSIEPENTSARYESALQLFREGFYRESLLVDQQILDFDAGNEDSLIRSATAHLRLYEPLEARGMLARVTRDTSTPRYLRARASYHSLIGEHADAISICRRVLSEYPEDLKTRLVLGDSYLRSIQLQRSIDAFATVAASAWEVGGEEAQQLFVDGTLSHARALSEAKRYDEALVLLETTQFPPFAEDAVLDTYLAIQNHARRYGDGIRNARVALADALGNPGREIRLRSWLGLFLARNGEYASAIQELSVAEQMSDEPLPEAIYGKYQAYRMLGDQTSVQRVRAEHLGPFANDSFLRVRLAELATEDCDCCFARQVLQPLDSMCDTNPLIANRLGEACLLCAPCPAAPDCACYFERALTASPSNVQALLGIARTLSHVKKFQLAYCYYQKAERYMPDDLDLKREIARMVREWKGPDAAQVAYDRAMQLTTTEPLLVEAKRNPALAAELEREYESRAATEAIVATEMTGKQLSGWLPLSAICTFEGLTQLEPHNQDAIFEIGQAFSQLNRTCCAIEQYERLLCLNPCHREAQIALDRNRREISPQLHFFSYASRQQGRQNLSTIDHLRSGALLQYPLGDEDEFLQLGYARSMYDPPGAPRLDGHIAIGRIQWKPVWPVVLFGELNYESYEYGFRPRFNYDVGGRYRFIENSEFRVHFRQQNVAQNRVSIRRDIHRWGAEVGNFWHATQRFEIDTLFQYWEYSDDNQAWEGGVHSGYQLTYGRDRMRWLTDFDWMAFRREVKFGDPDVLETVNSPYFAPDLFWFVSGGLELRHYFGCDTFKAGNRRWIEGYAGGRLDSDGVAYGSFRGEFVWNYHTRMTSKGYFEYLTSTTYTNGEVGLKLTLRY